MHYADIKKADIANGLGVRVSVLLVVVIINVKIVLIKKLGILIMEKNLHKKK